MKTGSLNQIREVQSGSGGKGQNSLPVEFGLGSAGTIDSLIVRWPSGTVQGFTGITPNIIYSLTEGGTLVGVNNIGSVIPNSFTLSQNYPNPFNPMTKITFDLPKSGLVKLSIYDVLGKEVGLLVNEALQSAKYEVDFNADNLPSGVYFYKLEAGGFADTKKMILLK